MLLQLGAEKTGRDALVRSLLSLRTVCLELGSDWGRGMYYSYQGGAGQGEWAGWGVWLTFVITGIEKVARWLGV